MRNDPLVIEVSPGRHNEEVVLRLTGPLTLDNLFDFQRTWRAQTASSITLDLTKVPYVDSAGIGSLVNIHVSRQKLGGEVHLRGVCERVLNALAITRVDKVLSISEAQKENPAGI